VTGLPSSRTQEWWYSRSRTASSDTTVRAAKKAEDPVEVEVRREGDANLAVGCGGMRQAKWTDERDPITDNR
jgi:hypothetical protein